MGIDPPPITERPRFAQYLFDRRITARAVAPLLKCSHEQVRRICLPYSDPQWRSPSDRLKQAIEAWTGGEVPADGWERPNRPVQQ